MYLSENSEKYVVTVSQSHSFFDNIYLLCPTITPETG